MNYPHMVYKNGRRGEYRVCNDAVEMVDAANDGFYPMGKTKKAVLADPSIKRHIKAKIADADEEKAKTENLKTLFGSTVTRPSTSAKSIHGGENA